MAQVIFKSNINCGSCIQKVTPILNALEGIDEWRVDTTHPEKLLTVEFEDIQPEEIVKALDTIGFQAELYSQD